MNFGGFKFEKTFIIAEIGDNHNGDVTLAEKLISSAKDAGADAVKFQTWITEEVFTKEAPKARYQVNDSAPNETLFEMNKKLELCFEDHQRLQKFANDLGILFFSKTGSLSAVDIMAELKVPVIKIGSADLTFLPLLEKVATLNVPIILSTGMGNLSDVEEAIASIRKFNDSDLYLMHCTSNYPARPEDSNLKAIQTLRTAFDLPVGYSDHTGGTEISVAAVALGACMIEKHFTLDKDLEGPDHKASLEPAEFKKLVNAIRNVEAALGDGIKKPVKNEKEIMEKMRKSIVAAHDIEVGTIFSETNLTCKRPGVGLPARLLPLFYGRKAGRLIPADKILELSDL